MVFFFQPAQLQGFAQDGVCEDALVPIAGRGFRGAGGQGRSAGLEVLLRAVIFWLRQTRRRLGRLSSPWATLS